MTETRQAEILARWLDSSEREAPPAELSREVVETVLALKPERAPPPRLSVLDILDAVSAGPLAEPSALPDPLEVSAAARFAELLDDGADDEHDPGLEALFALRPDLAPAPRVSIFDILGEVRAGPLADPILNEAMPTLPPGTGELPMELEAANTVPPEAGVKPPRRRFWVWLWPGPMALVAAAVTLFLVLPAARDLPVGFPSPASAPSATMAEAPRLAADETPPAVAEAWGSKQQGVLGGVSGDRLNRQEEVAEGENQEDAKREVLAEAKPADPAASGDMGMLDIEAAAGERAPNGTATAWLPIAEEAEPQKAKMADEVNVPAAPPPPATVASTSKAAAAPATGGAEVGRQSSTRASGARPAPAPSAAPRALAADSPSIAEATNEIAAAQSPADDSSMAYGADGALDARRRGEGIREVIERRQDRDDADLATGETPDRHQLARANRALALGDMATAEARLRPLLTSDDHEVVVEASLRLCRIYLAQARIDEARSTVHIGLAAGPEPARLYSELQQISAQLGP